MPNFSALQTSFRPDYPALIKNILRKGTPKRVHFIELFHDPEIADALVQRFDLMHGVSPDDPDHARKRRIALQRFSRMDYVTTSLADVDFPFNWQRVEDQATLKRQIGRNFMDEHAGPITNWQQFEQYPWPDPSKPSCTREIEWYSQHLPQDMCLIAFTGHFAEYLSWLMGYETLCYALVDQPDLVQAIYDKLLDFHVVQMKRYLEFDRVKIIWASDDMGFRTGTLLAPPDMRQYILSGHKILAQMAHDTGRPYILHCCGNLRDIMDDLVQDVKIDGKHSYEDTIEDVRQVKRTYGREIALLGGIDLDFLARSDEATVRQRVHQTLDTCLPGGGYCLGTGNSVTNYVPLDNYLAMLDEGIRYSS